MMSISPVSQPAQAQSASATARFDDLSTLKDRLSSNADVKACCLPPELTIEIFLETRKIWSPTKYKSQCWSGWIAVLHVCSAWRKVALSTPILWQNIDALKVHPKSTAALLIRSADLPLHLTFVSLYERRAEWEDPATLLSVFFNAAVFRRLETLVVSNPPWKACETLYNLLSHEAPNLRKLGFANFATNESRLTSPHPQLRLLSLHDSSVPHDFSLLTSALTHLKLQNTHLLNGQYVSSVKEVLSSLSTLSSLEHLDFDLLHLSYGADAILQKVAMPSGLKYMSLTVYLDPDEDSPEHHYSIKFLKHLSVPTTADVNVSVSFVEQCEFSIATQTLLELFSDDLGSGRALELEFRDGYDYTMRNLYHKLSFYSWDPTTKRVHGTKRLDFPHEMYFGDNTSVSLISKFRPKSLVIASRYLQRLVEDVKNQRFGGEFWKAQDACCLTICFSDHHLLWPLLNAESPSPTFPLLDTIVLTGTYHAWKETEDDYRKSEWDFVEKIPAVVECAIDTNILLDLVSGLIKFVELRRQSDTPLRQIRVDGRLAEWDVWDKVRGVVDVVVV